MYPLLAFSVLSLGVIVERAVYLWRARTPLRKLETILEFLSNKDIAPAVHEYSATRGINAALGLLILESRELPLKTIEERVSRRGAKELAGLAKNLNLLDLVGKVSPMIGLLGTVLGLSVTFKRISGGNGLADPGARAGGIWEALITTVTGLFIAIPAIIFHHLYENRIKQLSFEMKDHAETVIALVKEET